jgi:hypothetical protein
MSTKVTNGLDLQGQPITNTPTPSATTDVANKGYVDAALRGLNWKDPVRVASTATITLTAPGATIDGVTMAAGDSFLAKDQATSSERGIYVWNGAAAAATRRADAATTGQLKPGTAVTVLEGATNGDKVFTITSDAAITIGTTAMTWGAVGGTGQAYTGSNGVTVSGASITGVAKPSGGLAVDSTGFSIDTAIVVRKVAGNIGNGTLTVIDVTHGLGTLDVQVQLRLASTGEFVIPDAVPTDANTVRFTFPTAPAAGAYRYSIQG